MYARRNILRNKSYSHVFFRCHNREFFLKNEQVRDYLLFLWAKYKQKYKVNLYEFNIMDNHAHMLVYVENVEYLGHFMRTVNSQLARYINLLENRDSQAIRERYKSPLITSERYMLQTMQYIWLNRYMVDHQNPDSDPYCSVAWRLGLPVIQHITKDEEKQKLLASLLDQYPEFDSDEKSFRRFVRDLLNAALSKAETFLDSVFENIHTIGDEIDVIFRGELLSAFHRDYIPLPEPP